MRKGMIMKKYIAAFALLLGLVASAPAQWQVQDHAVPIGNGPGVTGFNKVGPCSTGQTLAWTAGSAADPTCSSSALSITVTDPPYNAVCDGITDDATAIQNAINALPVDGGVILFPTQTCRINTTLVIGNGTTTTVSTRRGVVLRGLVPPGAFGVPFYNGYPAIGGPRLLWGGAASSAMIAVAGPLHGWGLHDLLLDCGSLASSTGLSVTSAGYGDVRNLSVVNCNGAGISSSSVPNTPFGYNVDSIRNNWQNIDVRVPAVVGAKGVLINGDSGGTSNTDYNTWTNVFIRFAGDANPNYGLYLGVSDSNVFTSLNVSGGGPNSVNIVFDYTISAQFPNGNLIFGVDSNNGAGGTMWQNIGAPSNTANNYVFGISQANGGVFPNLAGLSVFASGQVILSGSTSGRALIVPQAVAGTPTLSLPTTTGTFQTALPAPLAANTTTGVAAWSGMSSSGILYAGSATTVATDRCTMDGNQSISCTSATAFAPQGVFSNTTTDANSASFIFNKSRSGGNTSSGDQLGSFIFRGFANSALQNAALATVNQAAASSGSNIPSVWRFTTSNTAGQLNQQLSFDQNAHLGVTAQATAPTISAGCNGAGSSVGAGSSDFSGNITGQTAAATTCTITFGTAFANTPSCVTSGDQSAILTQTRATTTLVVTFASTANYRFNWICSGV
jgi:hypothetical protein